MSSWRIVFSRQAQKDAKKLSAAGFRPKTEKLLDLMRENPFVKPPRDAKLVGDLSGCYSRRITIQHRLVYEAHTDERTIHVLRMWTRYE